MRICEMVTSERPREKAIALGIERLSEVELLALLIGSGTSGLNSLECASKLLYMKGGLPGLAKIKQPIDIKVEGIGRARSLIIIAAIELANRLAAVPQKSYLPVWHSETIFNRYRHRFSATNEKLMILYFSRQKSSWAKTTSTWEQARDLVSIFGIFLPGFYGPMPITLS